MIVFSVVFGNLAQVDSEGIPYPLFSYTALVPWTYFSGAVTQAGGSLTGAAGMFTKVYFPRMVIPIAPVLSKLVDFAIAFLLLIGMMAWFRYTPSIWVIALVLLIIIMVLTAAGVGMWLTALSVQYRDVKYALTLFVQILMYASPVIYPANLIPGKFRLVYALNPMTGVIEGFRSALLSTNPMPWDLIGVGALSSVIIFASSVVFFRYKERIFADVV
jgi:lipopolysaccharide transport system permease protein